MAESIIALHKGQQHQVPAPRTRGETFDPGWTEAARRAWDSLRTGGLDRLRAAAGATGVDPELRIAEPPARTRGESAATRVYRENVGRVALLTTERGLGSGTVVEEPGLLLTNFHVVVCTESIDAYFRPPDGGELRPDQAKKATVIAASLKLDLALVEVDDPEPSRSPVRFGELRSIDIGSDVYAIGHPQGLLWSFTGGVVSQIRENYFWAADPFKTHVATVIQTQTPINPGNSGGPLFNARGEIVGINSFGRTDATGLNFAVAIGEVEAFLASRPESECQPKAIGRFEAGGLIAQKYDRDGDARADLWAYDLNRDGVVDVIGIDTKYNGVPSLFMFDVNGDGLADFYHHDIDEDGVIDVVGIDLDRDGLPDGTVQCEPA